MRFEIGAAFNVPVIVTNLLENAKLKQWPGARADHLHALASNPLEREHDYHWYLYSPDKNKRTRWFCSEARRTESRGEFRVLKLDGAFGRWKDVDSEYTLQNGQIIDRRIANAVDDSLVQWTPRVLRARSGKHWKAEA
jgi:hypothetical protein